MGEIQRQTLLRKSNDATRGTGSAIERGLPLVFSRAAEDQFALPLLVSSVRMSAYRMDDLQSNLDEVGLFLLLEGPEGATGAAIVSFECMRALLEHLTMGRVLGKAVDATRTPTAVDAALMSSVLDGMLGACDRAFGALESSDWGAGHHFGSMVEDRRTLVLSLAGNGFSIYDIELSLGEIGQKGRMQLVLPNDKVAAVDEFSDEAREAKAQLFRENVMLAPAEMRAVLHRITMPYDKFKSLAPGDLLEVPKMALQETSLEIHCGDVMASGALGQMNGQRAVRLVLPDITAEPEALPAKKPKPKEEKLPAVHAEPAPLQVTQATESQVDEFDLGLDDLDQLTQLP
ncbi:FliM/FliN family flagellar motor C-terminal domain-containing protein [Cognatishimia sp. 1_MG-2023]|uniref:FliM/FliN family flagellar motor C-terminal domain-containing protein n=1 Tax=Cognatishimia sp. 1_MG-2023 TaxID=3062642 RepID=UPI0026E16BB6|nr:FliM/FliN family flagellar motor C-terminal domain-containing protein [Cognatishimia sp. 1_MG-2023]MDO6726491.1 FliM/FliN family flagellar motor C-terminal domain-containing protein [Cognatishimia sp. 1_MG-2023]